MFQTYAITHPFGWDRENILAGSLRQAALAPHSKTMPDLEECMLDFSPLSENEAADDLIDQFARHVEQGRRQAREEAIRDGRQMSWDCKKWQEENGMTHWKPGDKHSDKP